jgi:hypothetical protein
VRLMPKVQSAFRRRNFELVRSTPRSELLGLIESMRPRDVGLVRLGPDADGGYLLPDDLVGIAAVFSPGVSDESGFELGLASRGVDVYMADGSVDGPAGAHDRFHFEKKFVGSFDRDGFVSLDSWAAQVPLPNAGDLLLQMDIEGAEYECLLALSHGLQSRFRTVIVEFHGGHHWLLRPYFRLVKAAIEKLLATHVVVHLHANNCCGSVETDGLVIPRVLEVTFHRRDRVPDDSTYARPGPHPLDVVNVGSEPLLLSHHWYGPAVAG